MAIKLDEKEAKYIQVLHSVGLRKKDISEKFNYKYMDVINVLRGNTYNHVTGILNVKVPADRLILITDLLQRGLPYREVAHITGIEYNKVRNIRGYLNYLGLVKA